VVAATFRREDQSARNAATAAVGKLRGAATTRRIGEIRKTAQPIANQLFRR